MNFLKSVARGISRKAREKRAILFKSNFDLSSTSKILDLGAGDGSHIRNILAGTEVAKENVYIADIREDAVLAAQEAYGFIPVVIPESGKLEFPDKFFDVVFCSSVIEHVTAEKADVWTINSGEEFQRIASLKQTAFAKEIRRLGKGYFVQTPYKWFPLESHTWLPFVGWLPRRALLLTLSCSNKVWIKATAPDWYLLNGREMMALFPEAKLVYERVGGFKKSMMAIKRIKT